MKLHHIAAAAALASLGGHAFATDLTDAASATNRLNISGSSALKSVIKGMMTQNCSVALKTWTDAATAGSDHNVYYCAALSTPNDFGAAFNGQSMTVVKREAGGSAMGSFPVAQNLDTGFLDISAAGDCAATAPGTCTILANLKPDAGISDMEPTQFNDPINRPSAFASTVTFPNVANANFNATPKRVVQQVFGLLVNNKLYADLQADQGLGAAEVPSVSAAAFSTIYSPGYASATRGWVPLFKGATAIAGLDKQVNICTRAAGSGTRATAQLFFNQTPSGKNPSPFAGAGESTAAAVGTASGLTFISEGSSSGVVRDCVNSAEALAGYAVGLVSMDTDITGKSVKFVKISGATPGRVSAREGQYGWVYEATMQINKLAAAGTKTLANAFGTAMQLPTNIQAAGVPDGVMAPPSATCATAVSPVKDFCSRVSRGANSASPLLVQQ